MAKPNNAKLVGAFVLGALVLLVAAVAVFGGGALFRRTIPAVAYFKGSVAGLSVGAPVAFQGVTVGAVSRIILRMSATTGEAHIPVYLEFNPDVITFTGGRQLNAAAQQAMIERGLRAQLVSQSLITGQLMVLLDYFPDSPADMVGGDQGMVEIPTVPSEIQEVKNAIADLPLRAIADVALGSLTALETLLRSPDAQSVLTGLAVGVNDVHTLLAVVTPQIQGTMKQANGTIAAVERTADRMTETIHALQPDAQASLANLARLLGTADRQAGPLISDLRTTAKSLDSLVEQAQTALFSSGGLVAARSSLRQNTEDTMRNLSAASASLRGLAAELERNPNVLLMGKSR